MKGDNMKEKVSRREFIGTTAAVGACMCGLNGCNILLPQTGNTHQIHPPAYEITESNKKVEIIIDMRKAPELQKEGSAVKIVDSRIKDRIIIANTAENDFKALSISCTHNGAEVEYKHDQKIFKCVSFNRAEFSLDGRSIDRMNLTALTSYSIRRQNEKVIISFPA
jgi:nitrite reductase/ring-hydroxylating ferredoxin subunit